MKLRLAVLPGSVVLLVLLSGCAEKKDTTDQPTTTTTTTDQKSGPEPSKEPITAETIAHAGHAKLFDKHLKEIPGDPKTLMALQEALLSEISKHDGVRKIQENDATIA